MRRREVQRGKCAGVRAAVGARGGAARAAHSALSPRRAGLCALLVLVVLAGDLSAAAAAALTPSPTASPTASPAPSPALSPSPAPGSDSRWRHLIDVLPAYLPWLIAGAVLLLVIGIAGLLATRRRPDETPPHDAPDSPPDPSLSR